MSGPNKPLEEKGKLTILYGSQTGNAEDLAKRIGLQAKSRGFHVWVGAIDDFQLKLLPRQRIVIFVCSTTGHGQEPENMKLFYNFIRRRDLPNNCLGDVKFAIYGLGSSSYAKFNYVSKILFKRLTECGAKPLQELTLGDEQHASGCDGAIYPKLNDLWYQLLSPHEPDGGSLPLPSSYTVTNYAPQEAASKPCDIFTNDFKTKYSLRVATCIENRRLTSNDHFQDTRHLRFKTTDPLTYEPGDVCTILPENSDENVQTFIEALDLDPNQRFSVIKKDPDYMLNYLYDFIPEGLTVRHLVRYFLDIQSIPRRSFFQFIWSFSSSQLERDKLKELSTTEGQEELYDYCTRPKRNILEVLLDFPHTIKNIPFDYLFDIIPPIKPRSFSIASAVSKHPNELHLLVGVVKYNTIMKKIRLGLCSNYLAKMKPESSQLTFFLRQTAFKLPQNPLSPIIMIGPGLGLAPMRSFIEERALVEDSGSNHMYFGCRYEDADYYFVDELKAYVAHNRLRLRVAFSRQDPKRYVQDLLKDDAQVIRELMLDQLATMYISGNSKLPEDIRSVIKKIMHTGHEQDNDSNLESYIVSLENDNRLQYDCW